MHQLLTFPAIVLGERAGRLNPEAIDRPDDALRFVLGLWGLQPAATIVIAA